MPQHKRHQNAAEKQRAYRQRRECLAQNFDRLATALTHALDAGRSHRIADNLPDEPTAKCEELIRRLDGVALVVFPPRHPRKTNLP